LIDEAQIIPNESLTELRILSSAHFDSEALLSTVLCGDNSLPERFRHRELTALGSRIRTRLNLRARTVAELRLFVDHLLDVCGAPALMTDQLKETVIAHCAGDLRMLVGICAELLATAAAKEQRQLDEQLYFDTFGKSMPMTSGPSNRKPPQR
jgi:type II secretory pathway predicted ATPase ExeA